MSRQMNAANLLGVGQSFLAILGGFITIAALVTATTALLTRTAPAFIGERSRPGLPYMSFNVAFSAAYAFLGGWVTARLVTLPRNPLTHSLMLALVVLVLGAASAIQFRGRQPVRYQIALTALTPMAVLCGGLLRMHQLGYRW